MQTIPTALSSHVQCLICREKHRSLREVKKKDMVHAFLKHRFLIKKHARVCDAHYDDNGFIRKEEFFIIETTHKPVDSATIQLCEFLASASSHAFDQFKDLESLEDEHCKHITGWSKTDFLAFSDYIHTIRNTKQRTKEQLIALYRYWLRSGIDQKSLAIMFGNDIKQNEISNYLDQIRTAINKDFVEHFLGVNKDRAYYLQFNTTMTNNLYALDANHLVLIADGTYSRIEKSSNNHFQYSTYSAHKSEHLFKPFIICCADGFIMDCYGPFPANANDAEILKYVIENDANLKNIMIANQTLIVVDRGFRDCVKYLRDNNWRTAIPTCSQLEEDKSKRLTIQQTSDSRLVTKCRFIIEKKIGEIKMHQALDNRRNSEVGRLQIDYRITCAMLNFLHRPCGADSVNAEKISARMLEKYNNPKENILEQLLPTQLGTVYLPYTNLANVQDFPKLSKGKLKTKIFYGSFYLRACKSYISDFVKNDKIVEINMETIELWKKLKRQKKLSAKITDEMISQFEKELVISKIIGVELAPRHQRGINKHNTDTGTYVKNFRTRHSVFIQFVPTNSSKSILGYVCSCNTGRRQVGCCVHSATVIYYFSYLKARMHKMLLPGEHLRSVLVNMNESDSPNKPRHVRAKRRRIEISESEASTSDNEDIDEHTIDLEQAESDVIAVPTNSEPVVIINRNIHHPDEWNESELVNFVRTNTGKSLNWFEQHYVPENKTARSTDESNISQFFFSVEQQLILSRAIEQSMQTFVDLKDNRIKRFIVTHLFQKIMTDIVTETYGCSADEMTQYIGYISEQQRILRAQDERYLETIKTFNLMRMDEWLNQ